MLKNSCEVMHENTKPAADGGQRPAFWDNRPASPVDGGGTRAGRLPKGG